MEAGAMNVEVEEGEGAGTVEIRAQIDDIETSSKIRGTIIEEEEPLEETGDVFVFITPQRKRKILSIKGE